MAGKTSNENFLLSQGRALQNFNSFAGYPESMPEYTTAMYICQPKHCYACKISINEQESVYLVWQGMYFCDTVCLYGYQKKNLSVSCANCFIILPEESLYKYVFRFDKLLQFCSIKCFYEYKSVNKLCQYCLSAIFNGHPTHCSEDCVKKHTNRQGVFNKTYIGLPCYVCESNLHPTPIHFELEGKLRNICNSFCLSTFSFIHQVKPVQCHSCQIYFNQDSSNFTVVDQQNVFRFCSQKCENFYIFTHLKVLPCDYCHIQRFDTDLIKRYSKLEPTVLTCSVECYLKKYSAREEPLQTLGSVDYNEASLRVPLISLENVDFNIKNNLQEVLTKVEPLSQTKNCFIIKSQPTPEQKNVGTMCFIPKADQSTCVKPKMIDQDVQTDSQTPKQVVVPVPVPVYLPAPVPMFQAPVAYPVPFPFPLPIPFFIPLTRKISRKVFADLAGIRDLLPIDTVEAEVLTMAELLEKDVCKSAIKDKDLTERNVDTTPFNKTEKDINILLSDEAEKDVNAMFSDEMLKMAHEFTRAEDTQNVLMPTFKNTYCEKNLTQVQNYFFESETGTKDVQDENKYIKTCLGIQAFRQWKKTTKSLVLTNVAAGDPSEFTAEELGICLALFVKEVKRPNGKSFTPDTIFYLCLAIQKYLNEHNRLDNIFFDEPYKEFVEVLDQCMKTFPILYLDSPFIVTRVREEHLWDCKLLGAHSPYVLLSTILYNNMKYFNLISPEEHTLLNISHFSVTYVENKKVLRFYNKPSSYLEVPENNNNPERCPVRLFEFYSTKLFKLKGRNINFCYFEADAFCTGDSPIWYTDKNLDEEVLSKIINRFRVIKDLLC